MSTFPNPPRPAWTERPWERPRGLTPGAGSGNVEHTRGPGPTPKGSETFAQNNNALSGLGQRERSLCGNNRIVARCPPARRLGRPTPSSDWHVAIIPRYGTSTKFPRSLSLVAKTNKPLNRRGGDTRSAAGLEPLPRGALESREIAQMVPQDSHNQGGIHAGIFVDDHIAEPAHPNHGPFQLRL